MFLYKTKKQAFPLYQTREKGFAWLMQRLKGFVPGGFEQIMGGGGGFGGFHIPAISPTHFVPT